MAFGSTPTDSSTIPIGCVYVPGVGFKAIQGGTLGTLVGAIRNIRAFLQFTPITATEFPMMPPLYIEDFGMRGSQPIVLRGTGDVLAVNLNAVATITGWLFDISVEWTEE